MKKTRQPPIASETKRTKITEIRVKISCDVTMPHYCVWPLNNNGNELVEVYAYVVELTDYNTLTKN